MPFRQCHRRLGAATGSVLLLGLLLGDLPNLSFSQAQAQSVASWVENDHLRLRLISAQSAVGAGEPVHLGLQIVLQPGWTFYWRSPGDTGLAPLLDWSGSGNIAEIDVGWPAPRRKKLLGSWNFIYSDEVVLPVALRPADPGQPVHAELLLDYGVCKDVCVPYSHRLTLELPPGRAEATDTADLIDWYRDLVPVPARMDGLHVAAAWAEPEQDQLVLQLAAPIPLVAPELFLEGPEGIWFGEASVVLVADGRGAEISVKAGPRQSLQGLGGQDLRVTIVDMAGAVEHRVVIATSRP